MTCAEAQNPADAAIRRISDLTALAREHDFPVDFVFALAQMEDDEIAWLAPKLNALAAHMERLGVSIEHVLLQLIVEMAAQREDNPAPQFLN